jgi:4-amino-4-deoxy-L-arabinose transferase-like glycosyltransferase
VAFKKIHIQILLLWIFLVILGLNGRSYFPIDETRYATVAWNMWLNGDYLVPYLNGIAYSHKPPLLFWLINLGWKIFGVNDWWPRLIPSLFALASVFITRKIAGRLWPTQMIIKDNASLILVGSGLWVIYSTALMFDMMIAFFTLLGILGLLIALQDKKYSGWLLLSLAIGGGLLAKGPTILLQLLPVALLAFWWSGDKSINIKNWYLPLLFAVLGGIAIALVWAIPAGISGGGVYQQDIFWGQTTHRMIDSFAHNRPLWWYLVYLPLLFFPWFFWGAFWKGLFKQKILDMGLRLCLAWALPVFVAFSFISGKQVHYLLPLFPALALVIARCIDNNQTNVRNYVLPVSLITIAIGLIFIALPYYANRHTSMAAWLGALPQSLGFFIVVLGLVLYALPKLSNRQIIMQLSVLSIALITVALFVIVRTAGMAYDIRPISTKLKMLESQHIPLAHSGKYPGIYNFIGRLNQSPTIVKGNIEQWFTAHPNGRLIEYYDSMDELGKRPVEYIQPYKGILVVIMTHEQWLTTTK